MKTNKRKMRSTGIFALVLVLLVSMILPLSAAGSAIDEAMGTYVVKHPFFNRRRSRCYGFGHCDN